MEGYYRAIEYASMSGMKTGISENGGALITSLVVYGALGLSFLLKVFLDEGNNRERPSELEE